GGVNGICRVLLTLLKIRRRRLQAGSPGYWSGRPRYASDVGRTSSCLDQVTVADRVEDFGRARESSLLAVIDVACEGHEPVTDFLQGRGRPQFVGKAGKRQVGRHRHAVDYCSYWPASGLRSGRSH